MSEITVPKLNTNDATYVLVEWLADDGQPLRPGDPVATIETSKATTELECDTGGFLHRLAEAGSECGPGQVIARLLPTAAPAPSAPSAPVPVAGTLQPLITAPAQALIDEHRIDPALVQALGLKVIRRTDLEPLLPADDRVRELPRAQRGVAAAVSESHRGVPAAYAAVTVAVGAAQDLARTLIREYRALVGLPELLVAAVAALHERHPMCFATRLDERTYRLAEAPHVGITLDMGKGLYVPVVHDAARLGLAGVARKVTKLRTAAARGEFHTSDLSGGNITVTLHTEADMTLAIPFVLPGQACALALTAPRPELVLDPNGDVVQRTVLTLGLAYDHRLLNGRDVAAFLGALRTLLEEPGRLVEAETAR